MKKVKRRRSDPEISQPHVERKESGLPKAVEQTTAGKIPKAVSPWAFNSIIAAAVMLVSLVVYYDFFLGPKTLLFTEFGSDSINIFYPFYALISDYLREVGVPSWSFRVAMGQNIFPYIGNVLLVPVVWLPKAAIAKALIYQNLLYLLIVGTVFARFLAERGVNLASCLLGALLLCFSAYMCAGSCWYFHAYEVVCLVVVLLAAEKAVARGTWLYLALSIVLVGLLGSFHLYLSGLLLCFYIPFRLVERYGLRPVPLLQTCIALALAAFLGLALSAILSLDNFYALVNSPRGSGLTSMVGKLSHFSIFGLDKSIFYISEALRPFSTEMVGGEDDFRGWYNYFEAPMSYCGLLCLLIFPQIFVSETKRRRILYAIFTSAILVPSVFPWFRYLFWAFQGEYFRTFSLFSVIGIIALSMAAFCRYMQRGRFNLWVLGGTTLILVGILYLPLHELQNAINPALKMPIALCLLVYTVLLAAGQIIGRQAIVAWLVILLTAAELIYMDRITISARHSVTKQQLNERVGYNDETVDAIRDLRTSDDTFFRLTKTWGSSPSNSYPSLNDAMVFGYYGTSSHSSFNNVNYTRFLVALDVTSYEEIDSTSHWAVGLVGNTLLSVFACEKYLLTANPVPYQLTDYYESVGRYSDTYLFRNRMFLPLGLTFTDYIAESTFLQLPSAAKWDTLLRAVVISDKSVADQTGLSELTFGDLRREMHAIPLPDVIAHRRTTALKMRLFHQTRIAGSVSLNAKSILVLQTPFDAGWHARQDGRAAPVVKVDVGLLGVVLDAGDHEVELRYTPPFLVSGAIVSLASLAILIVVQRRWPRMRLPE
jgi:hypothetical protein